MGFWSLFTYSAISAGAYFFYKAIFSSPSPPPRNQITYYAPHFDDYYDYYDDYDYDPTPPPPPPPRPLPRTILPPASTITDTDQFLSLLLSIPPTALSISYNESTITKILQQHHLSPQSGSLPLTFNSFTTYRDTYLPLILYDCWASIVSEYHSTDEDLEPFKVKFKSLTDGYGYPRNFTITLTTNEHRDISQNSLEDCLVLLHRSSSTKTSQITTFNDHSMTLGFVDAINTAKDKSQTTYQILVSRLIPNISNGPLVLQPIAYIRPTLRTVESLFLMQYRPNFYQSFLVPSVAVNMLDFYLPSTRFNLQNASSYNDQQRKAIIACCNAVQQRYENNRTVLIQGPPGTGKTHTLVGIVQHLLAYCTPKRLLICAPSNGAIDEIALRLIRELGHNQKIVRIGNADRVHDGVQSRLLKNLVENRRKSRRGQGQTYASTRRTILSEAAIILSTLNSVHGHSMEMFHDEQNGGAFSCVIVDEASQCTEPELLMPLVYPISKLILIGDHKQLPATVISRIAQDLGFGRSIFQRLHQYYEQVNLTERVILPLLTQFRMHHAIVNFPARHFYENKLLTPLGTGQNDRIPLKPYVVFDIAYSRESSTPAEVKRSKLNLDEAEFIVRLVKIIVKKIEDFRSSDPLSLGIITFYNGQKDELLRRLDGYLQLPQITLTINTVDAFQGQECDIVLLSCVRAFDRGGGSVGFVRSAQRMNVALTRAKSALFICINGRTFRNVPKWAELVVDAQERRCYLEMRTKLSNRALQEVIAL